MCCVKCVIVISVLSLSKPASACEQYPVLNYTLEVKGPSPELLVQLFVSAPRENFVVISSLSENAVYSFRVLVSNSVGVASSTSREFCEY